MNRFNSLLKCLACMFCAFCLRSHIHAEKPNIILIVVDDLGWMDLSCQGSTFYETPHIDKLAQDGTRFTNAYAASAVCSPSRAAILTGRYPARIGMTDWIRARFQRSAKHLTSKPTQWVSHSKRQLICPPNPFWLEHEEITIAEALDGYVSAHIGKWHLGDDDWYPTSQGFDINIGGCDFGQPPSYFDPHVNERWKLKGIPHLPPRQEGEYLTDREADEAVTFIQQHQDKPFFLHLAHYAVHTPLQSKPEIKKKFFQKPKSTKTNQKNAHYAAMIASVDDALGQIIKTLNELGLRQRTILILTSDNGGLTGKRGGITNNAPLRGSKGYAYEGGLRVPLIVSHPGYPVSQVSHQLVCGIDLFPTILAMAGRKPVEHKIDGLSLLEHLKSVDEPLNRDSLYWHFPHYRHKPGPYSIIREGNWKLIRFYQGPQFELYNLKDDISETNNMATSLPEKVKAMNNKLMGHLMSVNAMIPRPNPAYKK